jgi:thiol:disulfide interchange protein DsbD
MEHLIANLETYLAGGKGVAYLVVFISGVLSSFTPCVYPMIPITISVIGGQKKSSRMQGLVLSLFYVLGIAITYSVLGVIAVATGSLFGAISNNTWVLFAIANVCILFGLNMLDVFMIPMPAFLTNLQAKKPRGGSIANVLIMGIIFGLVASPCTAPVLGVILAFVSTTKSYAFGSSLLFVYALGMGVLLMVIGTFAGMLSYLPKSGGWMEKVKKIFGWIMIAAGEYFLVQMGKSMF